MTKRRLLLELDSYEITEWQAFYAWRNEEEEAARAEAERKQKTRGRSRSSSAWGD